MAAIIEVNGTRAHIAEGRWHSADRETATDLQRLTDPDEVPTSAPDPDDYLAELVAKRVGGQIIELNPPDDSDDSLPDGTIPVY